LGGDSNSKPTLPILASQGWSEQGAGLVAIEDEAQADAQKSDTWKCEQPLGKNDKMGTLLVGGLEPWNFMTFQLGMSSSHILVGKDNWLVVSNMNFIFPYIGKNNPN